MAKFANSLKGSGRAARWNSNDVEIIYTSSSRSLACLENVVHRNQFGLNQAFSVIVIEIPDSLKIDVCDALELPAQWTDFVNIPVTQMIGDSWVKNGSSAVLRVPSSIIFQEYNYLINPEHKDFLKIKIKETGPFVFDNRIKQ